MLKRMFFCAAAAVLLTGCSAVNFSVDTLLTPPMLTREQSEIYKTLIASTGKNITLKYPNSGDSRSAFTVGNIDSEATEEAIVFYSYNSADPEEASVRVSVLDKDESGEWNSKYELAGSGGEVDTVKITRLGDDMTYIVAGYSTAGIEDKVFQIYLYSNGVLECVYEDNYTILEVMDINSDGANELVTVKGTAVGSLASVYRAEGGLIETTYVSDIITTSDKIINYIVGKADDEKPAIFIDELGLNGVQTEILFVAEEQLQNPMITIDTLRNDTFRQNGYYCADYDKDGIVEIPITSVFTGHSLESAEECLMMTKWYHYLDYFMLEEEASSYYNIADGYVFTIPNRWSERVTVKTDRESMETVFYKYDVSAEGEYPELMRITVATRNEMTELTEMGYEAIASNGQLVYAVRLSDDESEPLVLTLDEVKNNFYIQ